MTAGAVFAPCQMLLGPLQKYVIVKRISVGGVLSGELYKASVYPAYGNGIVEKKHTRVGWFDVKGLDAGLREDGDL
jgi:hypothetical protein